MKNKKRGILFVLLIAWMIVIFMFSNETGDTSQKTSNAVIIKAVDTTAAVLKQDIKPDKKEKIVANTSFIVRKAAHFTEYFILNLIVYLLLKTYNLKYSLIYSILFCACFATSDEIHQLFVAERSGKLLDVLIDTSGAIFCSIGIYLVKKIKCKNIEKI